MSMFWHATKEIARKEILQMLRTKRLIGMGIVVLVAMVLLTLVLPLTLFNVESFARDLGGDEAGDETAQATQDVPYVHNAILLFFLGAGFILSGFFLFQLMPIVLTSDSVSSEWQSRTIFLVLSKPVPRAAFVVGKFLGIGVPLALLIGGLLMLDYLMVVLVFPGWPTWNEVGRFFGTVGLVMLGSLAFTSLALMFSTITRSNVVSMLLALVAWIIVLPLLGNIGFFVDLATGGLNLVTGGVYWSTYLNPAAMMQASADVLVPEIGGFLGGFLSGGRVATWWASGLALLGHIVVYLTVSLVVVQARNFE